MEKINIRKGTKEDLPQILLLIQELALYEKAPKEVTINIEQLEKDGFGHNPLFQIIIAENQSHVVGMSFYYFRYSTWKGKMLYLEDLIVTEKFRSNGIGYNLFNETLKIAKESNCCRMVWQVLDWNKPAFNFYDKFNSSYDSSWVNGFVNM